MCGIVAIISKKQAGFFYRHRQMFETMLFLDTLRGDDSTGVFGINRYGNAHYAKDKVPAYEFLKDEKPLSDFVGEWTAAVGHNRKATFGKVTAENAHPFIEDNILLVHNGTLTNHKEFNIDVEVDSHVLTHLVANFGIKEAVNRIEGAFTIATYDAAARKLYFVRNAQRPLHILEFDSFWILTSESWIGEAAAARSQEKASSVEEVPAGVLLTFDMNKDDVVLSKENVTFHTPKKLAQVYTYPITYKAKAYNTPAVHGATFPPGSIVNFEILEIVQSGIHYTLKGVHLLYNNVRISSLLDAHSYCKDDIEKLKKSKVAIGEVIGRGIADSTGGSTVFVRNVDIEAVVLSLNGTVITAELMKNFPAKCSKCHSEVDMDTVEESYVKIMKKDKLKVICYSCVDEQLTVNPNWGGLYDACNTHLQ